MVGSATIKGKIRFQGVSYEIPDYILQSSKQDREKYVNNLFSSPDLTINQLTYSKDISSYPSLTMECHISAQNFVTRTKKRMVFNPYLFDPPPYLPKTMEMDFSVNSTRVITDTISYSYPFGYSPEYIPETIQIESAFGKFQCQYRQTGDKLLFTRRFEYYERKYGKEDAAAFTEFVNKIADSGRQLVLLKKN